MRKHVTSSLILKVWSCLTNCMMSLHHLFGQEFVYLRKPGKAAICDNTKKDGQGKKASIKR